MFHTAATMAPLAALQTFSTVTDLTPQTQHATSRGLLEIEGVEYVFYVCTIRAWIFCHMFLQTML